MSYRQLAQKDTEFREYRKQIVAEAMQGFELDLTGCRKREQVQQVYQLTLEGYYSEEIAEKLGMTPKAVQKAWRRYGFPEFGNIAPPRREKRPQWKGGVKVVKGYEYARTPGHPYASKHGSYVAVHRLVVEQHLGRYLEPGEVVDHIDGDTRNNDIENLRVFASNGEHLRATLTGKPKNISPEGRDRIEAAKRRWRESPEGKKKMSEHGKANAHHMRRGLDSWAQTPEAQRHFQKMGKKNHHYRVEGLRRWRETAEGQQAMKQWGMKNVRHLHPNLYPEGSPPQSTPDQTKTDA